MTTHDPVSKLIFELSKLPGIGEKTATRLAYHILKQDGSYARALSEAIVSAKQKTGLCTRCLTFAEGAICRICSSVERDHALICVVERPADMQSIENAGVFRGVYHVLHGALSPLDGIGPEELKIRELMSRLGSGAFSAAEAVAPAVREVILATNPSVEGEATALYLARLLGPLGVRTSKLAHGIPVGGQLEYTDRQTIAKALENRVATQGAHA
jgi:recombination protein RecR